MTKDQGGSITGSRAYRHELAVTLGDLRAGRFTPTTALIGHREVASVVAKPSRAKGKARRRKVGKK